MTQFEYITAFLSIVSALAVAEVLVGLGRLIREREHVKIYWVHVAWMMLVILVLTNGWWSNWRVRAHDFQSYFEFLALLAPTLMMVIVSFLLSPPIESGRSFDLRAYYYRHIQWIAFLVAGQMTMVALFRVVVGVERWLDPVNAIRAVVVGVFLCLGLSANPRLHAAAVLTICGLFALSLVSTIFGAY